jgi:putative transposase
MPAKSLQTVAEGGAYYHVYNLGVESKNIFADDADFQVFLDYLKDYLSTPGSHESKKAEFTVKGKTFKGVPHQPKNYFGKVELTGYNLKPNHFHLLLVEIKQKSLQALIRSLCTRYSIYFNKKYKRTGPLFEGSYKSIKLNDDSSLLLLTRHFHKYGGYSTYHEYLGRRKTPWVKTKTVQSITSKTGSYKDFVEKYELNQRENELLQKIIIEKNDRHVEKSNPEEIRLRKPLSRIPELLGAGTLFVLLLGFGIRNIAITAKSTGVTSTTLGINTISAPLPSLTASPKPKMMLTIKYTDEKLPIEIRQKPTVESKIIGQSHGGDKFELISKESGWSQIKLPDGSIGFILSSFVEAGGANN